MFGSIMVQPRRIAVQHSPNIGRHLCITPIHRRLNAQQVKHKVDLRAIRSNHRAIAATRHRNDLLNGRKIIFAMRIGQAISSIRIGFAIDMRNAKFVTRDFNIIGAQGRCGFLRRCQRLPNGGCDCRNGNGADQAIDNSPHTLS